MIKKLLFSAVCAAVLFAGCTPSANTSPSTSLAPSVAPSTSQSSAASLPSQPDQVTPAEFSDENAAVKIEFGKTSYTANDVIDLKVTITNKSQKDIVFVKGSGSNVLPDALKITMGSLVGMFYPQQMTMDYQVDTIKPGASVTFDLPHAAFVSVDKDAFAFGKDITPSYFNTAQFTPATPGDVEGTFAFSYSLAEEVSGETSMPAMDDLAQKTIEGKFSTKIS